MQLEQYDPGNFYDELFAAKGKPRPEAALLIERINSLSAEELQQRQQAAQHALFRLGVAFNVRLTKKLQQKPHLMQRHS